MLSQHKQHLSYPSSLDINENDSFDLPVLFNQLKRTKIQLIKKENENILEDLYDKIQFIEQEGKDYNKIQIKGLSDGTYLLNLKDIQHVITLTVHKGQYWEGDTFILKRNCLFENRVPTKMIKIAQATVEESKDGAQSEVTIKLEDFTKDTRVHVSANLFQDFIQGLNFYSLYKDFSKSFSTTVFPFAMWKNIYMSNRELSDEFRYVFDRKYAERYQGNTLERPKLVLKRTLVGTTQIDQEQLNSGQQYQQQQVQQDIMVKSQNTAPVAYQRTQPIATQATAAYSSSQQYRSIGASHPSGDFSLLRMTQMTDGLQSQLQVPDMQNFLKHGPLQYFNLSPNENGEIKFKANLSSYSQLQILAVDRQSVAQKSIDLEINPIQKRDLSLTKHLDTEKGFTESRLTYCILKDDTHQIEDITSTEMQLIDDMKKVRGVLDELMKMRGTSYNNTGSQGVYQELIDNVIMKWLKPNSSLEEKHKMFSKYYCHELNIFIFMKDQDYFQSTAKQFIEHKMEKTFIDHYLLGHYDECLKYFKIQRINQLNPLEQCFLADILYKQNSQEDAKRILENMRLRKYLMENNDRNYQNRIFDTVLNLNIKKSEKLNQDLSSLQSPLEEQCSESFQLAADPFGGFGNNNNFLQLNAAPPQIQPMMMNAFGGGGGGALFGAAMPQQQQRNALFANLANQNQVGGMDIYVPEARAATRTRMAARPNMMMNSVQPASYGGTSLFGASPYNNMDVFGGYDEQLHVQQQYEDLKKNARLNFEEIQQTSEYVDTNYFKHTNYDQQTSRFTINSFFVDYCEYICSGDKESNKPFLTSNFIANADNAASALITFALIDLPYESESHNYKTNEGRGLSIQAVSNVILFKKEVREAPLEITNDILIIHRYDKADQQSIASSTQDEFLTNTAYQCEVIMTNVSPQQKEFSILYQIPQGSLPLEQTKYMKSIPQTLQPYTTQKLLFYFYFPSEGDFIHFPSNVSANDVIIAKATNATQMKVVNRLSINKKETFRDVIQSGNREDILEFLRTENLLKYDKGFNTNDLLWMLKEKEFYLKVVDILRKRFLFFEDIWKFGFYHSNEQSVQEYLEQSNGHQMKRLFGKTFESSLISYDEICKNIRHLDYYPMINSRAHQVGDIQNWTLNRNVRKTYERFLKRIIELKEFNLKDQMQMVYYLQLQDRIQEAIKLFERIKIDDNEKDQTLKLQYDYFQAYFDFFTGQSESFKVARAIVRKYEDYPVAPWRMAFLEILDQLNEYDGEIEEIQDIDDENMTDEQKKQKKKQSIAKEPRLDVEVSGEKQQISIEVANIKQIAIKFYIIDAEILFSRTPFLKENTEEFSYVKPCHVIERDLNNVDLNSSIDTVTYLQQPQKFDIEIPENLKNQNMVIEFNGEGKQIFKTYYSTQIKVIIQEAYGELKVTDINGIPLPKVYVKVFYQKTSENSTQGYFFRDGYTDIRGKFEYAQTSGNKLSQVKKFAILVLSDALGSIIRECNPPKFDAPKTQDSDIYGAESQQQMMKQQRVLKNVNWHKANYKKAC